MLIHNAEVGGRAVFDVRIERGRIAAIGSALGRRRGEVEVDARGGALLRGLHDHHTHLMAAAAAGASVRCGPPHVGNTHELRAALLSAHHTHDDSTSLRGIGYHESVAGDLGAAELDAWLPGVPVRIQHRSGALWILNSTAMHEIDVPISAWPAGAERDEHGTPTGRFYRLDDWLRAHRPALPAPDLAPLSRTLAGAGVTGVTDATPTNDRMALEHLAAAQARGALLQRLMVMGDESLPRAEGPSLRRGCVKIMLDEHDLPPFESLTERISRAHALDRNVAIHSVTRTSSLFALAALESAGTRRGDRLEHVSVAPAEVVAEMARLDVTVVTQPHFIHERGDRYLKEVESRDRPDLYRVRSWLQAGVALAAGTDAPFGDADPWQSMAAAVERSTRDGKCHEAAERVSPESALQMFQGEPSEPGRGAAALETGQRADLCLLTHPWAEARTHLDRSLVRLTLIDGRVAFDPDGTCDE